MKVFDKVKATRVCRFFEAVLLFKLLAWEREILRNIFGLVDELGTRCIRRVYLEIPKKNGKSEVAAGVALYMLVADCEPGAEIYGAATTKEQAGIVFRTAAKMVARSPYLRSQLKVLRSTKTIIKRSDPTCFFRALAADGGATDGINPHCVIIDELHRWKTGSAFELYDVLTKGTVARKQPLIFQITTAGSTEDESPLCHGEHEYTLNIKANLFSDDRFYGKIFAADPADDPMSVETWTKANPSLETNGGFLKLEALQAFADEANNNPNRLAAFKRYHLGIWISTEQEWISPETWARNSGERRTIIERPCYLGLDLSTTTDLSSLVALFPDEVDGTYDVLAYFWMAEERLRARELADRVPYSTWRDQGLLVATPGNVIDVEYIKNQIRECSEVFNVQQMAFDPWHADQLAIAMTKEGVRCVPVPFRFSHLSEATKQVEQLALQGKFRHEGNKLLAWNARCTRVTADEKDNYLPVKPNRNVSSKRVDGMVALILAMSRAMFHEQSAYDERGILST